MGLKNVDGYELTYDSAWTKKQESRDHWGFYWRQANLIEQLIPAESALVEIGVGSGFLLNYLRSRRWNVTSVDIDDEKDADYIADASQFDFCDLMPNGVLAFEVFEHIPFPLFARTVESLSRANPSYVIFSLPLSVRPGIKFDLKLPKIRQLSFGLRFPKLKVETPNHHWELNPAPWSEAGVTDGMKRGLVARSTVSRTFSRCGYHVQKVASEGRIQFFLATPFGSAGPCANES